ncbi:MAG: DNA repair protein RadC [Verrucomicrobiales bacterium]|nr:DNA repair protein RadC [Verrucomicrobiales bacterium]
MPVTASPLIRELPMKERPREKLLANGAGMLSNVELLALFFGTGRPGVSAIDLGRELLKRFGSLRNVSRASVDELLDMNGIGPAKAAELAAVFEFAKRVARERYDSTPLDSPDAIFDLVGPAMQQLTQESVRVVLLNARNRLIRVDEVHLGTVNESIAQPRDILRKVLAGSAAAFVLVHNHPSGDPSPSRADLDVTRRVKRSADDLGVDFLDHLIVGSPDDSGSEPYFSFREGGLL